MVQVVMPISTMRIPVFRPNIIVVVVVRVVSILLVMVETVFSVDYPGSVISIATEAIIGVPEVEEVLTGLQMVGLAG